MKRFFQALVCSAALLAAAAALSQPAAAMPTDLIIVILGGPECAEWLTANGCYQCHVPNTVNDPCRPGQ